MLKITKEDIDILTYQIEQSLSKEKLFSYIILMVLVDVIQSEDIEPRLKEQLIILMLNTEEETVFMDSYIRRRIVSTIYNDELFESVDTDLRVKQLLSYDEDYDNTIFKQWEDWIYEQSGR